MFEQTFKNIDDILHKDAGCGSELDYVEQTSWVLFLKYLDDLERDRATAAELTGKTLALSGAEGCTPIIDKEYQWNNWAAPKITNGNGALKIDHNALTGDDLTDFVNNKLFPYLKKFKLSAESADTIEYKIGEIFSELKNRIQSGYNLREVINRIDELRFRTHAEKHEMSHLYEDKIKNMGNAGRNGGEYYTPRPLITTIVKVVAPKIGDKIYDGAVGSAGFLCEAFDYLKNSKSVAANGSVPSVPLVPSNGSGLSTKDWETLQKKTFYGKEKKSLAYIIGIMNMILHGVEAPNIIHTNTLAENLADIQEKDRYDVVLANPPFGGKERAEVQQNFPIKTGETASLFLQHFIKILKAGGKAGVVIKNTFLSNTDNATVAIRKTLLESCNLHTVLDLPGGTFTGAGVKTVVLFFEKGKATQKVWFYSLNLDRNLGKTNPLNVSDLADFVELQKTFADSENSWTINIKDIDQSTFDLSVKNPNKKEETALRQPQAILEEMKALDEESAEILNSILGLL
ncbi:MAG: class I SAM-dependent DNA methyltransferase [Bacteroidales bacterium]|nr:class I SAM-dependent DNA methyltransferase [Bacteroidales bacterium]